jgi:hypothetical protein
MRGLKLSKPESFEVEASDGQEIEGWIMKPVDFEEGKKYPQSWRSTEVLRRHTAADMYMNSDSSL